MKELLKWDVYEVKTKTTSINGVMVRGRIRKLCIANSQNVIVENAQDVDNCVRFAVLANEPITQIAEYINSIAADAQIICVIEAIRNPVISKLKVNDANRYTL